MAAKNALSEAYWKLPEPEVQEMLTGRCEACSRITYAQFRADSVFDELLRPRRLVIGSLDRVVRSAFAGCRLCRLFVGHITQSFTYFSQLMTCYFTIDKVGLSLSLDDELSLHCWNSTGDEVRLSDLSVAGVIELKDYRSNESRDALMEADARTIVRGGLNWVLDEGLYLPRLLQCDENRLKHNPSTDVQPMLLHHWMTDCLKNHSVCHSGTNKDGTELPTRILDVGELNTSHESRLLVTRGLKACYVMLSHCWGDTDHTMALTHTNFDTFVAGISDTEMPKVFYEAIALTRNLGYRYLWIDSMCIIQPTATDNDDWDREGARMGQYYSQSILTLAASAATDNTEGMLHARACSQFKVEPFPLFDKPVHREWDELGKILNRDSDWLPILQPKPASWLHHVQNSPLSRRAWVLQERLLVPRTLHCTLQGLFWECSELRASEYEPLGCGADFTTRDRGLLNLRQLKEKQTNFITGRYWRHVVEWFSALEISFQGDRLPALAGLARSINEHTQTSYIAGHFLDSFLSSLLWFRLDGDVAMVQARNPGAPSWSWASTSAQVKFTSLERQDYPSRDPEEFEWKAKFLAIVAEPAGLNSHSWLRYSSLKLQGLVMEHLSKSESLELVIQQRTAHEQWRGHIPMPRDDLPQLGAIPYYKSNQVFQDLTKPEDSLSESLNAKTIERGHQRVVHDAFCDKCNEQIVGTRHRCLDCMNIDYCSTCITDASPHHPDHRFEELSHRGAETAAIAANHSIFQANIKEAMAGFMGRQEAQDFQRTWEQQQEAKKDHPKPVNIVLDHTDDEQNKEKFMLFLILSNRTKTFHEGMVLVCTDDGTKFRRVGFFSTESKSAFDDAALLEVELV